MRFTRFIFRPRFQSMWIRALSEAAEAEKTTPAPKPAERTVRPRRVVQIHCAEHV